VQMKTRVAGVLAASACAVGVMGAPAFASTHNVHIYNVHVSNVRVYDVNVYKVENENTSILSDNTISAPINICGNAIAIFGFAEASCQGGAGVFLHSPDSGW
jgi:hypothetical protein